MNNAILQPNLIYEHPLYHRTVTIKSRQSLPNKAGNFIYFIRLNPRSPNIATYHKIGTTNRPLDRMKELLRAYKYQYDITILWLSPVLAKSTTLIIEDRQKKWWKEFTDWQYVPTDRFIIPSNVTEIIITIKKEYHILI